MAKKASVPKRIAGVKIPKPLRQRLKEIAASQNGKAMIAEALAAAGAALAVSQARPASKTRRVAAKKGATLKAPLGDGAAGLSPGSEKLANEARNYIEGLKGAPAGDDAPLGQA